MKDDLKRHIQENREDFELYSLDAEALWTGIEEGLDHGKARFVSWKVGLRIAASIAIIFVVSIGVIRVTDNAKRYADGISLKDLSPELAEAEYYYNRLVQEKFEVITSSHIKLDPVIQAEFQMLDSAYLELKNDLKDNVDSEEVIDAMIQNYRIKLQILEQILDNIQSNEDKENEEGISI